VSSRFAVGLLLVALSLGVDTRASIAQELCVVCTAPDAVYRCRSEGVNLRDGDPRIGLLCITEIANADGHASCSVRRQQTTECEGTLRTVTASSPPPSLPGNFVSEPAPAAGGPQPKKGNEPPGTVAELAERTASSSKEELNKATGAVGDAAKSATDAVGTAVKKTGGAVSDAAKKSWRCLSSLFSDC